GGAVRVPSGRGAVQQASRVLFEVHPDDAHGAGVLLVAALVRHIDVKMASHTQRQVVLRDLVALHQVGVVVVLAVELGEGGYGAVEGQAGAHGLPHRFGVDHGQGARHAQAYRADVRVGGRVGHVGAA